MVGAKLVYINKNNGESFGSRGLFILDKDTFFDYGQRISNTKSTINDVSCFGLDINCLEIPKNFAFDQNADKWEINPNQECCVVSNENIKNENYELNLPDEISYIHEYSFSNCSNIFGKLKLPASLLSIDNCTFSSCRNITGDLVIPDKVEKIGIYAFRQCLGLTSIHISKRVKKIENNSFYNCDNLIHISVDSQNKFYDSRENCNAIIDSIKNVLILGCQNTIIPDSVTGINSFAFRTCEGLKKLFIPKSVTRIDSMSFYLCKNLEQITVDFDNPSYDSRNDCNAIINTKTNKLILGCKNTIFPENVAEIGESAFCECDIKEIVIPSSVSLIEEYAFADCINLINVEIEQSDFLKISDEAFGGCTNLTTIVCRLRKPPIIDDDVFDDCDNLSEIFVPQEVLELYKKTHGWREYKYIIKPIVNES